MVTFAFVFVFFCSNEPSEHDPSMFDTAAGPKYMGMLPIIESSKTAEVYYYIFCLLSFFVKRYIFQRFCSSNERKQRSVSKAMEEASSNKKVLFDTMIQSF